MRLPGFFAAGGHRASGAAERRGAIGVVREAGPPDLPPAVEFHAATLRLGDNEILHEISLRIERGTICSLLAPSGGGKTTLLRLILGIYAPTSGQVLVLGDSPAHFTLGERRQIGYMPQGFVLYPELSVQSNLKFMTGLYGMSRHDRSRRINALLDMVELQEARNRPASELSGGMQRRLQLAAALMHGPEVLVIDEPTAGIDPLLRAHFWDYFRQLRDAGHTLVVTTQYVNEADYCDQAVLLKNGRLLASGSPASLRERALGAGALETDRHPPPFETVFLKLMEQTPGAGGR